MRFHQDNEKKINSIQERLKTSRSRNGPITERRMGTTGGAASMASVASVASVASARGPRAINIQRSSAGFGFTLRHFIVYPPDSVSVRCPFLFCSGANSRGFVAPISVVRVRLRLCTGFHHLLPSFTGFFY